MAMTHRITSFMYSTLFFLLIFAYVLNVKLGITPNGLSLGLLAVMIIFLFMPLVITPVCKIIYSWSYLFLFLLIIGLYSIVPMSIIGIGEQGYLFMKIILCNITYILFSIILSLILLNRQYDFYDLMRLLFYVSLINAVVIIVSVILPNVRYCIESVLYHDPNANINYLDVDFRLRGLAAAGGASLSIFMGLSILMGIIAVEAKKISSNSFLFASGLILMASMFVGRTGLGFGVFILSAWIISQIVKLKLNSIVFLLVPLICCSVLAVFYPEQLTREIGYTLNTDRFLASLSELMAMLVVPNDLGRLVFGFGFFEADVSYRSDSGYIKTIFSIGVPLTMLFYLVYAYVYLRFVPQKMLYGSFFWLLGLSFFFLLEIKEPFIYQNFSARCLILVAVFIALESSAGRYDANYSYNFKS